MEQRGEYRRGERELVSREEERDTAGGYRGERELVSKEEERETAAEKRGKGG